MQKKTVGRKQTLISNLIKSGNKTFYQTPPKKRNLMLPLLFGHLKI